jgi:hypothetical protein
MKNATFAQWVLKAQLGVRTINPVQVFAAVLCVAGLSLWLWGMPYLKHQHRGLQKEVSQLQARLDHLPVIADHEEMTISEQHLRNFYLTLGETHYAEQQVATVIALANKSGLSLAQTDYKMAENKNGNFRTYTVTIPLKGQYAMIRSFCDQMLLAVPFAALNELTFKRVSISNQIIETRVRFTLYLDDADGVEGMTFAPPSAKKGVE